jgi:hypothetical protein
MKLIGFLYDHYGPETFLYTLLGYGIAAFVLAVLMDLVGAQHASRFNKDNTDDTKDIEMKNELLTEKLEEDYKGYDASESTKDNEITDNTPSYDLYQTFTTDNIKDDEFYHTSERL